jgi:hypothetical protein
MQRAWLTTPAIILILGFQVSPGGAAALASREIEAAFRSAAGCLARDSRAGDQFGDPYLSYVYADEHLPVGAGTGPMTYRIVDAEIILTQLARLGPLPRSLARRAARAESALRAARPLWSARGFSNTLRSHRADGIALDTFCMVGWLLHDDPMAREVAAAVEEDRWLPPGWYDGPQSYRATADEAWCLRLVEQAGRLDAATARVQARLGVEFEKTGTTDPTGDDAFYEAWHLGMLAADSNRRIDVDSIISTLRAWAEAHEQSGRAGREDILEWANLASSDVLSLPGLEGRTLRDRALRILLDHQGKDGCWSIPGVVPANLASSFLTLRALVALQLYRADQVAGREASAPLPNPAPYAESPTQ